MTPAYVAGRQPRGAVAPSAACAAPSGSPLSGGGGRTVTPVKQHGVEEGATGDAHVPAATPLADSVT